MLLTVCGEDVISAREYLVKLKNDYKAKEFILQSISPKDIEENYKNDMSSTGLFAQNKAYFVDGLNSYIAKLKSAPVLEILKKIADDPNIHLINWEEGKSSRDIKVKLLGTVKEFKPEKSIFTLLDTCYPQNLQTFIRTLNSVASTQDEGFIFAMLTRHVRTLILAHIGHLPATVQAWQRGKLTSQAKRWDIDKLVSFYEGLAKIDYGLKTSTNIYGYQKSIELLACYFLK